jgi:formylglycine-generating enzyme required for sulfatase activity
VYLGYDPQLDREVALKVAKPGTLGTPKRVRRFLREARAAGNLRHPNIVPLFETGEDAGRHFLVSAFIHGRTLGAVSDAAREAGGLPLREAAGIGRRLAEALGYAHSEGIIHRDVKPENVMVDEKGEPLLMDFGLASRADPEDGEERLTQQGVAVGTPSYMAPEQARADLTTVGPAADQYALGCTLFELLTGRTPFAGPPEVQLLLHQTQPPPSPRKLRRDVPRDLETICLKCLEKDPGKRYTDCQAVADDLRRWLEDEPILARRPGVAEQVVRWTRRNPGRAAVVAGVVAVAIGLLVAWNEIQDQRVRDQLAAEKRLGDERLAAETQRADDRIAAEKRLAEEVTNKQRETRAASLVDALASADTAGVPRLVQDLAEFRDLTGPKLRELAKLPVTTKPGLHARLALLSEGGRAEELAAYLPVCRPEELLPIRSLLKPHAATIAPGLWSVLTDTTAEPGKRVRAACALAGLAPDDPRWSAVAPGVVEAAVRANPVEFVAWSAALEPVRNSLLPALVRKYPQSRGRIESGKLVVSDLAAEASAFDLTANLLARYTTDRPAELAELASIVDARHHRLFEPAIMANRGAVVPVLKAELGKVAFPGGLVGSGLAAVVGIPPAVSALDPDPVFDALAKRRANAAAVLLALDEAESMWPLLRFPKDGDPSARSYLIERLAGIGADPLVLIRRFHEDPEVSAKRALLIALGDFPVSAVWAVEREKLAKELVTLYRDHPDPGLHGAIDWLLRQRWGKGKELEDIDTEMGSVSRGRVAARAVFGGVPGVGFVAVMGVACGPLLPAPGVGRDRDWYVNGEGQTYAVVHDPKEFTLGSPATESGRFADETAHPKRIGRSFAIATKEVTVEQFLRFRPRHRWTERYSPDRDSPAVAVTWYDAAEYCNWLSEREGIPPDQWCYEPNKGGKYAEGMQMKEGHLKLTGYRLPTEAEWEYACRSGSLVGRYYGRSEKLLPRYGWYLKNGEDRAWPVGRLRPNDLGLFDTLGNAWEWLEDPGFYYDTDQLHDKENLSQLRLKEQTNRLLRGGSFISTPVSLRCAYRISNRPSTDFNTFGFRPSRTSPD